MRKFLLLGVTLTLSGSSLFAQRNCGIQQEKAALIAIDPSFAQKLEEQRASLEDIANKYYADQQNSASKTTATSAIPVIFHIILDATKIAQLGGTAGIARRVDSQIAVINRDFNRKNLDSTKIPSGWKSRYGNCGIKFSPAHTAPDGHSTLGYEIRTTTSSFTAGTNFDYSSAKRYSTGGLDAWDVTRYLNIWVMNFSDNPSLLGITTPPSFTTSGGGPSSNIFKGVCLNYGTFGKRVNATDYYVNLGGSSYTDQGRTLTHELGHYFELWHTWGDDGGACPWSGSMRDDGISDTPPESDAQYGAPNYTIVGGTVYDGCKMNGSTNMQPIGIPCLDFMDYTDDKAMYMFTTLQAGVAASKVASGGESYSLTQNPTLLNFPVSVADVEINSGLVVYPNPASDVINISYNENNETMYGFIVSDIMGAVVHRQMADAGTSNYSVNLSGYSKGIYFVTCNFASGSITRKILLQ